MSNGQISSGRPIYNKFIGVSIKLFFDKRGRGMNRKVIAVPFFISIIFLMFCHSAQANSPAKVVQITITSGGRFVPDKITLRQDEKIIFKVTAHKSQESTWPPDILHGFYLLYDNIAIIKEAIKAEGATVEKATIEIEWLPRFAGVFTVRCPYHNHAFGVVNVKQ